MTFSVAFSHESTLQYLRNPEYVEDKVTEISSTLTRIHNSLCTASTSVDMAMLNRKLQKYNIHFAAKV